MIHKARPRTATAGQRFHNGDGRMAITGEPVMRTKHVTDLGRRSLFFFLLLPLLGGISCHRLVRSGTLIDAYRKADRVPPIFAHGVEPPTRGWDAPITIEGGVTATVEGAQMVGGRIIIRYDRDGAVVTAVNHGDYIYPDDVRLNDSHDRLYVKASGLAGGISQQTWLHEYDLKARKELHKQFVDPGVLPDECPMPQK